MSEYYSKITLRRVFHFLLLLLVVRSQTTNYYIHSLDDSSVISAYSESMINSGFVFSEVARITSEYSVNQVFGDVDTPMILELPKQNGDISTDLYEVRSVFVNDKYVSEKQFYVNITYHQDRVHTIKKQSNFDSSLEDKYTIKCNYISRPLRFESFGSDNVSVKQLVSYSFVNLVILHGKPGLSLFKFDSGLISIKDLSEDNVQGGEVGLIFMKSYVYSKAWTINESFNKYGVLALQEDNSKDIYLYYITVTEKETFMLHYFSKINFSLVDSESIVKIGISEVRTGDSSTNDYIIGTRDKGIIVIRLQSGGNWEVVKQIDKDNNGLAIQVMDFLVMEKSIYILSEKAGLIILKTITPENSDYSFSNFAFKHPALFQIDLVINPFTGSRYIGLGVSQDTAFQITGEFFIELLADNELVPMVNKVFTSGSKTVAYDNFVTLDKYFTYMYDYRNGNLMVIRRGMLNSVPYESYLLHLITEKNEIYFGAEPFYTYPIYDYSQNLFYPIILAPKSNYIFYINSSLLTSDALVCYFKNPGFYKFNLHLQGEVCQKSIDTGYQYATCDKSLNVTYVVYGDASDTNVGLIVGLSSLGLVVIIVFFVILACKTECFRNRTEFKIDKGDLTRQQMYTEAGQNNNNVQDELIDNEEKEIDTHKAEYQLGMAADGKVYGTVLETSETRNKKNLDNSKHSELPDKKLNKSNTNTYNNTHNNIFNDGEFHSQFKKFDQTSHAKTLFNDDILQGADGTTRFKGLIPDFDNNQIRSQRTVSRAGYRGKKKKQDIQLTNFDLQTHNIIIQKKGTKEAINEGEENNLKINENVIIKEANVDNEFELVNLQPVSELDQVNQEANHNEKENETPEVENKIEAMPPQSQLVEKEAQVLDIDEYI